MELIHIKGNTWAADTKGLTIPFYKLNSRDIVLMDTGYQNPQRAELDEFLPAHGLYPKGILVTHCHRDHSANVEYLRGIYGCTVATGLYEAKVASDAELCGQCYAGLSKREMRREMDFIFNTDIVIPDGAKTVDICGARFGVLSLPGHTPGQIGFVTPDNVAYIADALMGTVVLERAKLPTVDDHETDRRTKEYMRTLNYDSYILAHKGVCDDIVPLIDRNIQFLNERADALLDVLKDGMSLDAWMSAFYVSAGMHTRNPLVTVIYERNFRSFAGYLVDTNRVEVWRETGENHYRKIM